jgi:hypothetical protein
MEKSKMSSDRFVVNLSMVASSKEEADQLQNALRLQYGHLAATSVTEDWVSKGRKHLPTSKGSNQSISTGPKSLDDEQ